MLALGKLERLNFRQGLNLTTPPTKHTHTHAHAHNAKRAPKNYTIIRDKIYPLVTLKICLLVYQQNHFQIKLFSGSFSHI